MGINYLLVQGGGQFVPSRGGTESERGEEWIINDPLIKLFAINLVEMMRCPGEHFAVPGHNDDERWWYGS